MAALYFIVDSILTFLVYAFLLRLLLPLVRADFRNPLSQAILTLTNWLVMPLRRLLPPIGRLDTASVIALLAVQFTTVLVLFRLQYGAVFPLDALLVAALRQLALSAILLYTVLIFVNALLSFVAPDHYSPANRLLNALCEPVLRPVRAVLPVIGGLDFSPLVVLIGLQALRLLIA